jgi:hypothetical protein
MTEADEVGAPADASLADASVPDASGPDAGQQVGGDGAAEAPVSGAVGAVMRELDTLDGRDLSEHPDVYQRIHTELQGALTAIDDA